MKKVFLLIFLFLTFNSSFAQKEKQYIQLNKNYSKCRIFLKNNQIILARDLQLINDTVLSYMSNELQVENQKNIKEIKFITTKKGTKVITGALIGGGIGLFSSVLAVATNDTEGVNTGPIIIGLTVGCAAIGALIGVCIPTWKRLYPLEM